MASKPTIQDIAPLAELALAEKSFAYFLQYVKISEPPQPGLGESGGIIPFQMWEHLMPLVDWLERPWQLWEKGEQVEPEDRQGVGGKARRRGFSWVVAAYEAWLLFSKKRSESLNFSAGEKEAADLLSKGVFVYKHLPEHWQETIVKSSSEEFSIESGGRILAFPSTKKAARSFSGTFAFFDEADYHEYIQEALTSVKPIIDSGGQILLGSTMDKTKKASSFRSHYVNAERIHYTRFFMGYGSRAHENEEHYQKIKESIPEDELEATGLSREEYMEREFPRTEAEMLSSSRVRSFFDQDMLRNLEASTQQPIQRQGHDEFPKDYAGTMSFWVRRTPRGKYAAATDTAHGVLGDYSVTVVLDLTAWRVVSDVMTNRHEPDEFSEFSMELLDYYRNPIWGIEDNEWGILVIKAAQAKRYPRLYHREQAGGVKGSPTHVAKQPGWHTDTKTRWPMWGELKQVVDSGELIIPSKAGLMQFDSVIRNPEKGGRPEAMYGSHDDYPTAVAIAYQMRKYAHARASAEGAPAVVSFW